MTVEKKNYIEEQETQTAIVSQPVDEDELQKIVVAVTEAIKYGVLTGTEDSIDQAIKNVLEINNI